MCCQVSADLYTMTHSFASHQLFQVIHQFNIIPIYDQYKTVLITPIKK